MDTDQIMWRDRESNKVHGGILIDKRYVICGCCGGVFDLADPKDVQIVEIIHLYEDWINIDAEITGGEAQ